MKKNDFALTLSSDLFRLKKLKSVFVALILIFLIIFLTYVVCWIGINLTERLDVIDGTPNEEGVIVDDDGNFGVSQEEKDSMLELFGGMNRESLMASGSIASIEFFIMIIVCIFVGKDFSNGTIRLLISRGANRTHIFFSKWLSMALLTVAYSLFAVFICGILYAFKHDGAFTGHDFGILMRCFSLELLANLSAMSIFMMIAFLCRSSGASLGVSIGLFVVLEIILSVISTVAQMSGGNADWLMFMPLQQMSVASSSDSLGVAELCAALLMPFVYIGISVGVSLGTFLKRDVK